MFPGMIVTNLESGLVSLMDNREKWPLTMKMHFSYNHLLGLKFIKIQVQMNTEYCGVLIYIL